MKWKKMYKIVYYNIIIITLLLNNMLRVLLKNTNEEKYKK